MTIASRLGPDQSRKEIRLMRANYELHVWKQSRIVQDAFNGGVSIMPLMRWIGGRDDKMLRNSLADRATRLIAH
jgi:hypothetical protein